MVAREYHVDNIDNITNQSLKESSIESFGRDVDAVSVTTRPGLACSLEVGLNYSRKLAQKFHKPLIPIHHMQAHALMPLLENRNIRFPFVALLISGGHCIISIAKRFDQFYILGETKDDAPGDCLDKLGRRYRLKNLGPPFDRMSGGASIETLASQETANRFKYFNQTSALYMKNNSCDFSFSGYRGLWEPLAPMVDDLWRAGDRARLMSELGDICASFQRMMLIQIFRKLRGAIAFYRNHWRYENQDAFLESNQNDPQHLGFNLLSLETESSDAIDVVVSGGVAANKYFVDNIRRACNEAIDCNMKVYAPSRNLCSDNGLMIAWNGMLHYRQFMDNKDRNKRQTAVVFDPIRMDSIEAIARSPMGHDLSTRIRTLDMSLPRVRLKEMYLGP